MKFKRRHEGELCLCTTAGTGPLSCMTAAAVERWATAAHLCFRQRQSSCVLGAAWLVMHRSSSPLPSNQRGPRSHRHRHGPGHGQRRLLCCHFRHRWVMAQCSGISIAVATSWANTVQFRLQEYSKKQKDGDTFPPLSSRQNKTRSKQPTRHAGPSQHTSWRECFCSPLAAAAASFLL